MKHSSLPFSKKNYIWMIVGVVIMGIGFIIMASDSEPYGFGFMGITLSPIIVLIGFAFEFYAIIHSSRKGQ